MYRQVLKRSIATAKFGIQGTYEIPDEPYKELRLDHFSSSKRNPIVITAHGNSREIACVCNGVNFSTLYKGPPSKCACGHWFILKDAKQSWVREESETK